MRYKMIRKDVIIIGAGGIGCAVARELSRYQLNITVLEKDCDVASGASGRNSAVVHAGFNNRPGSLMAKLCVAGNEGFEALCLQLDVPYKKTGKILIARDRGDLDILRGIIGQGEVNGCKGLQLIDGDGLARLAPGVEGIGGMYSPETAIFDPFTYCIALAENALNNGVEFKFKSEVAVIERSDCSGECSRNGGPGPRFIVRTATGEAYACDYLINCAGLGSDKISEMAGVSGYHIYPCRGEYFILDKVADRL